MRRRHLVELEDLPWFPAVLRDGGTAYLELMGRLSGHARLLTPPLADLLAATGQRRVVDLCSGAGGPVGEVVEALAERGQEVTVTLTDAYPNLPSLRRVAARSGGRIGLSEAPVSASSVPADYAGVRTIFNAFHHFRPEQARSILADAVSARRPVAVFELVSREPAMLAALLLSVPLVVTLSMPFWRPFRWQWIVFTWLIPVMQLFVLWDGVVSWLRIYSEEELRELVASIDAPGWEWKIGRIQLGGAPLHASWLTGRPVELGPTPT